MKKTKIIKMKCKNRKENLKELKIHILRFKNQFNKILPKTPEKRSVINFYK